MIRVKNIFCSVNAFRCVFLFIVICERMPLFDNLDKNDYLITAFAIWGCLLLLRELTGKRTLLEMRNVWLLMLILALYQVTIILNPDYLKNNIEPYLFTVIYLLVLCPPEKSVTLKKKYREIFTFFTIGIIPVTILSAASIWAHITFFGFYSDGRWFGYAADASRLTGFYNNANTAGNLSFLSIAFLIIIWTLLKQVFSNRKTIIRLKICIVALLPIHITMLSLCDSRTSLLALLLFVLLFSFISIYRYLSTRLISNIKSVTCALLSAVIITGAVYNINQPIRMGATKIQTFFIKESKDQPTITIMGRDIEILQDTGRLQLWKLGFEVIQQEPVFGVSPGGRKNAQIEANEKRPYDEQLPRPTMEPHNAYIQLAMTNGIPVVLLYMLYFILYIIRNVKKLYRLLHDNIFLTAGALLILCMSIAFWNLFESELFSDNSASTIIFWSGLSISTALLQYKARDGNLNMYIIYSDGDIR